MFRKENKRKILIKGALLWKYFHSILSKLLKNRQQPHEFLKKMLTLSDSNYTGLIDNTLQEIVHQHQELINRFHRCQNELVPSGLSIVNTNRLLKLCIFMSNCSKIQPKQFWYHMIFPLNPQWNWYNHNSSIVCIAIAFEQVNRFLQKLVHAHSVHVREVYRMS